LLPVDDDQGGAVTFRQFREAGGGIHDQRRAEHDEQVGEQSLLLRAAHFIDWHRLAEGDRRCLDPSSAGAMRHDIVALEVDAQVGDLIPLRAVEAMGIGGVAVQLDHFRIGNAGVLVQPVDVLGDDRGGAAGTDQFGAGAVAAVGGGLSKCVLHVETPFPGFPAGFVGAHEVAEIDRGVLGPDAAGGAEVGNAGFGADPGAGEQDDAIGGVDQAGEFFQVVVGVPWHDGVPWGGVWAWRQWVL
jgi:hypothetical protein